MPISYLNVLEYSLLIESLHYKKQKPLFDEVLETALGLLSFFNLN